MQAMMDDLVMDSFGYAGEDVINMNMNDTAPAESDPDYQANRYSSRGRLDN